MIWRHCSECKHSKYTDVTGSRMLRCEKYFTLDEPEFLTTNCTYATDCECFEPETAEMKTKSAYLDILHECGLTVRDARRGILKDVPPIV